MDRLTTALEVTTTVLVIVAVVCVALLVLIVAAPWKQVRDEPPLDPEVEAKLLLHRNPDDPTGEVPTTRVADLSDTSDTGDTGESGDSAGYDDLKNL